MPLIVIAQIHQCRGELQTAEAAYREALALAERVGEPQLLLPCYDGLATIYLDRGDRVRAEEYCERARLLCERTGSILIPSFSSRSCVEPDDLRGAP